MKKLLSILMLSPILAFQCSSDGTNPDCGCKSVATLKSLENSTATIRKIVPSSADRYFNILLDKVEPNASYFSTLSSCDSLIFLSSEFKDGSKVRITGDVKAICSSPNVKLGTSPIVIRNVEIIKGSN